jgi:spermidine synthase
MSLNDSQWLTEIYGATAFAAKYSQKIYDKKSDFQRIEIYETETLGRVLTLDGCFMVTDKDSFVYHEMLVHPAMAVAPDVRKVLVIGGGDGGTVTELVKYPQIKSIVLCEIDALVVESCKEFMPSVAAGLSDPRVQVIAADGAAYVAQFQNEFDLILVDSTDPVGPGVTLFEKPFYQSIKKGLTASGAAVFQTESPLFMADVFSSAVANLESVFGAQKATPYLATIPSYPGGLWSFTFCSEAINPLKPQSFDYSGVYGSLDYYRPEVHAAAFAWPVFVKRLVEANK